MRHRLVGITSVRFALVAVVLGVLFAAASSPPVPEDGSGWIHLEDLRRIAGAEGLPDEVGVVSIGHNRAPAHLMTGGISFGLLDLGLYSYEVRWSDRTGLIDVGNDEATQQEFFPWSSFDTEGWEVLQEALRRASFVVITHEHFDHVTGLFASPWFDEVAPNVRLTPAQLSSPQMQEAKMTDDHRARLTPWEADGPTRLTNGVVVIPAPGHTPGSQLVFVRLSSGQELLFAGDVVWNKVSMDLPRLKPRWVSWALGEDTAAIGRQVAGLRSLQQQGVHVIVAHDVDQHAHLLRDGLMVDMRGASLDQAPADR